MRSQSPRGVIFDMDGVLVDSEPFIQTAMVRLFAEKGVRVEPEEFHPYIGTGEAGFIDGVGRQRGVPVDVERDKARAYAIYLDLIRGQLRALPGVGTFIDTCRRAGLRMAVASSADTVKVKGNLRELGLPADTFHAVVTGSDVTRKKPSPDVFLAAAARLDLPPALCLVIEDAIAGVAAAKAAGSRCLALTTSFPADRLTQADWIAATLAEAPPEVLAW
jgi:beta-phosphoglucomutase